MKYIILCGSNHEYVNGVPRQLVTINGERILDRTIRLLRENGITDISITATDLAFHNVDANIIEYHQVEVGTWINCFPVIMEPTTYIFGDVYFSEDAIKTIVNTETECVEFFASAPPFSHLYKKHWAEPFAFKVVDMELFRECIKKVTRYKNDGLFRRDPIAWELWQVIKGTPINLINYSNYIVINDYTCDIDCEADIYILERALS